MTVKYSSAVHGTSVLFSKHFDIVPDATGMTVRPLHEVTQDYAHFSIPTPIAIDQQPLQVVSIWLRYANGHNTKLKEVRLHDGEHEIAAWNPHPFTQHEEIMTEVLHADGGGRELIVKHGLCLSVHVEFKGVEGDRERQDWIKFVAAGVDFGSA